MSAVVHDAFRVGGELADRRAGVCTAREKVVRRDAGADDVRARSPASWSCRHSGRRGRRTGAPRAPGGPPRQGRGRERPSRARRGGHRGPVARGGGRPDRRSARASPSPPGSACAGVACGSSSSRPQWRAPMVALRPPSTAYRRRWPTLVDARRMRLGIILQLWARRCRLRCTSRPSPEERAASRRAAAGREHDRGRQRS